MVSSHLLQTQGTVIIISGDFKNECALYFFFVLETFSNLSTCVYL